MKKLFLVKLIAGLCCSILLLSACSSDQKKSDKISSTITNSETKASKELKKEFTKQVKLICNSVDPTIFDTILRVNPLKQKDLQGKFDDANLAMTQLSDGFVVIKPIRNKSRLWQKSLENITALKSQVSLISKQYAEYVALLAESETNKDPARKIAILSRLNKLVKEYSKNQKAIEASLKSVVKIGEVADISKCKAFEVETLAK